MADEGEVDRILGQYGQGYEAPQLNSGDGEIASTPDILAQYGATERMSEGVPGFLRRIGQGLRSLAPSQVTTPVNTLTGREPNLRAREDHANPLMLMGGEGADTMASWMDLHPGVDRGQSRPQDILAPLGLSAMAPLTAVNNAAGIFGGRLARTADREALARAEEMAASGASRDDIWKQTGWFQGVDGKWRFEIDDSASHVNTTPGGDVFRSGEGVGREHPALFRHDALAEAYPYDLDSILMRYEPGRPQVQGSYQEARAPTATHFGRGPEIRAEGPSVSDLRSPTLHELQHHIQRVEGFGPGSSPSRFPADGLRDDAIVRLDREIQGLMDQHPAAAEAYRARNRAQARLRTAQTEGEREILGEELTALEAELLKTPAGRHLADLDWDRASTYALPPEHWHDRAYDQYRRTAGEVEARNVQRRANFSPEARRAVPPWRSQDVPDADQILARYGNGPQMSAPETPLYHGSRTPNITEFRPVSESTNDMGILGPVQTRRHGVFLTDNPEFAAEYGPHVGRYIPAIENPANITDDLRHRFVETIDPFKERDLWMLAKYGSRQPWQLFENDLGARFVSWLREQGYDSARFAEDVPRRATDDYVEGNTTVVLNPADIRPFRE